VSTCLETFLPGWLLLRLVVFIRFKAVVVDELLFKLLSKLQERWWLSVLVLPQNKMPE